jgi:predicted ATPase
MTKTQSDKLLEENEEVLREALVEEGVEEEYENYPLLTDDDEELLLEALVEDRCEEEYEEDPEKVKADFQDWIDWYMELGEVLLKIAMKERRNLTIKEFMTRVTEYDIYYKAQYDIYYEPADDFWYHNILKVCELHRLRWGYFEGEQEEAYRYNRALDY